MIQIRSVPVLQTAKVLAILHFLFGAVFSCVGLIVVWIRSTDSPIVTLMTLMALPILAGLWGFGGTVLGCVLYNQVATWVGGLSLDLVGEAANGGRQEVGEASESTATPDEEERRAKGRSQVKSVSVFRVKPNPGGKDQRPVGKPPAEVVCAEWVDIRNHGMNTVTTKGVCLYHMAYLGGGGPPECRLVVGLPDRWLKPGETLRIHSGQKRELPALHPDDRTGAEWHSFVGENVFNYNIKEGDTLILYEVATEETIDSVSYEPNPPEGAVLLRQGVRLIPTRAAEAERWEGPVYSISKPT